MFAGYLQHRNCYDQTQLKFLTTEPICAIPYGSNSVEQILLQSYETRKAKESLHSGTMDANHQERVDRPEKRIDLNMERESDTTNIRQLPHTILPAQLRSLLLIAN